MMFFTIAESRSNERDHPGSKMGEERGIISGSTLVFLHSADESAIDEGFVIGCEDIPS